MGKLKTEAWRLAVAGGGSRELLAGHREFFADHRVVSKGLLSRAELARCMREADVFVFPSLAEGSARVVFEALAAGCYVITTPNSGSIVEDGVHGRLVPPGNAEALANAIRETLFMDRKAIAAVGMRNSELIRNEYRQVHYGDKLVELYRQVLETGA
ncbi:MAG TPA: glycosyltransferase [Proteobacteria bacterium]|nr:glycosyltransferase [Pseudomonadota bacterium]